MAEATVKVQLMSVLRKIKATNRTQAAVWAMNNRQNLSASSCDR
jgi:two-component system nitrate/nitrite response regulator NarL